MKVYSVYHAYDVDGGYGDPVPAEELVATFESETDAKAFVKAYNHPFIYAVPYSELLCNSYFVRETEFVSHAEFDINKTPEMYGIHIPAPLNEGTAFKPYGMPTD